MINDNDDSVNELITKHLAGETSADEERELFAWVNFSEANRRHYHDLKKAFQLTERHFITPPSEDLPIDVDKEWDHFTESLGAAKRTHPLPTSRVWLRIAATLLLLMATGGILYYFTSPETLVYQTAANKQTVTLPDGSRVILNRYTSLSYDPDFADKNRTVNLDGEAFFEVQPDASQPFIVRTEKATVQVLGTSFNVNAYDSLDEVQVIVKTGVVSLRSNQTDEKVELVEGQKGIYSRTNERIASAANDDVNFLSWSTQHMVFVDSDLRSVIETLERTYHAEITIGTEIPPSCIVTVTFDQQTLESVLKVLESTLNLKYTINGNKVEITEAGC
ncbi:MAG: FecR domain-containing protein [Cyclobacteriaceae bacterium]